MGFLSAWTKSISTKSEYTVSDIFPFGCNVGEFTSRDIINIYTKILIDVIDRTNGIDGDAYDTLWDNCLQSGSNSGLISMLAHAMFEMSELYLVYNKGTGILRTATANEQKQIRDDYNKMAMSKVGVYVSFRDYTLTGMLKIYSNMSYGVMNALHKNLNISKTVQIKMNDMRKSTGLIDSAAILEQAMAIADGMKKGNDVLIDALDSIEMPTVDMGPTEKAMTFIDSKMSFNIGLPLSYITGEQTAGIGSTGEADSKAVERGLKIYYNSIIRPVLSALFGIKTSFKSHDFRRVDSGLNAVKTFELTDDSMISNEDKRQIVAGLFDIEFREKHFKKYDRDMEMMIKDAEQAAKAQAAKAVAVPDKSDNDIETKE